MLMQKAPLFEMCFKRCSILYLSFAIYSFQTIFKETNDNHVGMRKNGKEKVQTKKKPSEDSKKSIKNSKKEGQEKEEKIQKVSNRKREHSEETVSNGCDQPSKRSLTNKVSFCSKGDLISKKQLVDTEI